MKILILLEPGENGVFTYVESLCHFLLARGVKVHLGYSDRRSGDRLKALIRLVESKGGLTANMGVTSLPGPADIGAFIRVRRLAKACMPDVIHCHSSKAGIIGRSLALAGIRSHFVYQPHAYFGMRPDHTAVDLVFQAVEAVFGRIGTTLVVASDERRFAKSHLGIRSGRIRFVANGVDSERFSPATLAEKHVLRRELGIPEGTLVIGTMARLCAQKDPFTLYRAFASASSRKPGLHLLHVGAGELEAPAAKLAADLGITDRITRVRYLADPTRFYRAIDGFMLTSNYEGLSLASLEALSTNLPVILSRAPGNSDILELPLSHVWSAEPGDVGGFAGCIGLWRDSRVAGRKPNHRIVTMARYDAQVNLGSVLDLYRELANAERPPLSAWYARMPLAAWLALILCESTDMFSRAHTRSLLYAPFHFLTGVGYETFSDWNFIIRKVGHVLLYGTLSLLFWRAARYQRPKAGPGPLVCIAVFLTALVASLDEWHQTFIPSRTGRLADVALDTGAALAAAILVTALASPARRPQSQPKRPMRSAPPEEAASATR